MNKKYLVLSLVTTALLAASNVVFAEETATTPKTTPKTEAMEKVKENRAQRCETVTAKVDERINKFDENRQDHGIRHQKIVNGVTNIVNRLKDRGFDVTKLEADLKDLNTKIVNAAKDYEAFVNILRDTKTVVCGQSQGQFASKMEAAKKQLTVVRADTKDIRDYYINTIKADIKEVRAQKPVKTTTDTTAQ